MGQTTAAVASSPGPLNPDPHNTAQHRATKLTDALNRSMSWDLPQPPRHEAAVQKSLTALQPRRGVCINEDGLPVPEPFKIKMIEQITLLPHHKREKLLKEAGYNVFCLRSDQVSIKQSLFCCAAASINQWFGTWFTYLCCSCMGS